MAAMNTKVTAEAVASLRNMRDQLEELSASLKQEIGKLQNAYEENHKGLGHHAEQIRQLLEDLDASVDEANVPVKKLQKRLTRAAMIRDQHINNSSYGRSR